MEKESKVSRTLDIYTLLNEGKVINIGEKAKRYGVDERSIQRDIRSIRDFLEDYGDGHAAGRREVLYDEKMGGYVMSDARDSVMTNGEILAVSKILLESRAFSKEEISAILDKMIAGCVPYKNMKLVSELISNEKFHYVETRQHAHIQDKIWELGEEIKQSNLLEIVYEKQVSAKETVTRVVHPVAILFSEYYFYLNAYIVVQDEKGKEIYQYDYPTVFRIDRIRSYKEIGRKYKIRYADRFEEGEFRKRTQFMYPGKLERLVFRYTGRNVDAILDRLPTAKIVKQEPEGESYTIEAEVYGTGILMWLLSQGSTVEVIGPEAMREKMRKVLVKTLEMYGE